MNSPAHNVEHTVDEEWLASYVAGSLSDAKSLVVACQASMRPDLARHIAELEHVGGALMESSSGAEVSVEFFDKLVGALEDNSERDDVLQLSEADKSEGEVWEPLPLRRYLETAGAEIDWRFAGPGVERAPLAQTEDGERLYLLKARAGFSMPIHSHHGEEWTLILKGSYHVNDERFIVGDLHREDETCTHQPIVDDGEECICLVAIEGKLKFKQTLLKALQPRLGV